MGEVAAIGSIVGIGSSVYSAASSDDAYREQQRAEEARQRKNKALTRKAMSTLKSRTNRAYKVFYERRDEAIETFQQRLQQDIDLLKERGEDLRSLMGSRTAEDISTIDDRTLAALNRVGVRTQEDLSELDARTLEQFGLMNKARQQSKQNSIHAKIQRNMAIKQSAMKARGESMVQAAATGSAGRRIKLNLNRETGQIEADAITASRRQQIDEMAELQVKYNDSERNLQYAYEAGRDQLTRRQEDVVTGLTESREDAITQLTRRYLDVARDLGTAEADALLKMSRDEADFITKDRINSQDTLYEIANYYKDTAERMQDNLNNAAPVYSNVPGTTETLIKSSISALNAWNKTDPYIRDEIKDIGKNMWDGVSNFFQPSTDWNFGAGTDYSFGADTSWDFTPSGGFSFASSQPTPEWDFGVGVDYSF
jgi:hypothetical protein